MSTCTELACSTETNLRCAACGEPYCADHLFVTYRDGDLCATDYDNIDDRLTTDAPIDPLTNLDGIRADIEAHRAELPADVVDCVGCHVAVNDVPALIAALDSFDQDALRRAHAEGRAAAAADIRAFVEMKERSVRGCPPETAEAFRRNDAVLGAYRRAAEIAEGQP